MAAVHFTLRAGGRLALGSLDRSLARLSDAPFERITLERLRWFWLDSLFANISVAFFTTYLPLFALAYGATNAQVGQLAAVASLLGALALFPGARVIPWFGRRKPIVLLFGGGLARLAFLPLACLPFLVHTPAQAVPALIGLNGLISFANSLCAPAWTSLAADIVPDHVRGRFFAHRGQAINLVTLTVVPFAGWLIRTTNHLTGQSFPGYQLAFVLALAIGAVSTWCYAHIDEPLTTAQAVTAPSLVELRVMLRRSPIFLGYLAATLIFHLGFQISLPFFNVYLAGPLGASTTMVGFVNAAMPFAALLSQRWLGQMIDRRGNAWVLAVCVLPIPLFPLMWMLVTQPWQVILINLPAGVFWTGFNLAVFNLLLELAPAEARADATALYQFMVVGATVFGPLIGGMLADSYGYPAAFGVSAAGRLLGALAFLWWVARPMLRPQRGQEGPCAVT